MRRPIAATALALAAGALAASSAPALEVLSSVDPEAPVSLSLDALSDFEANIPLRVITDPSRVDDSRLQELVQEIDLRDGDGRPIGPGRAADRQADVVVGYSGGSAEIVRAEQGPSGPRVIGLFRDTGGQIVSPAPGTIGIASLTGEPRCFDAVPITQAADPPPMWFVLMLDRSGSMNGHMSEMIEAAEAFLDTLPDTAQCSILSFADTWTLHGDQAANACRPESFDLSGLQAGGATDIFAPLSAVYRVFGRAEFADWQRAAVILTDGRVSDAPEEAAHRREELLAAKGEALTFVYWLGDHDERDLRELADSFITHRGEVRSALAQYFEVLGEAFTRQQVLTLHPCAGAQP